MAIVWWMAATAAEPYCNVATYGYREGVPAGTGSRVVQDQHGYVWISTWNGLYRYDGYEFRPIRPGADNEVRRYSSRFRDIKMGPDGRMWCRIDDNIVLFDTDTYEYLDLQSEIESKLGEKIRIENAIRETTDGDIVLSVADGRRLIFDARQLTDGTDPAAALRVARKDEPVKLKSAAYHKTPLPPGFDRNEVAYSSKDDSGNIWIVTKEGRILIGEGPGAVFREVSTIDTGGGAIKHSTDDGQGQVWMVSNAGIHKIALGTSPLTYLSAPEPSQLRASMLDRENRLWMAWSDSEYVTASDADGGNTLYLAPDGSLSKSPVKFGLRIYSMAEAPNGQIWLGSKPDGLFRLTPAHGRAAYRIEHLKEKGNYYDLVFDGKGRLWMATLGHGIEVVEDASAGNPTVTALADREGYPRQADKARRLRIIGDSLIAATTTEGLLSFPMPGNPEKDRVDFRLHRSTPGDAQSLGNIATMDAIIGSDGRLYVATESDGLNILTSPLSTDGNARWTFSSTATDHPALGETTLTLAQLPDGRILAVGKQDVDIIDPTGRKDIETLGHGFWKRDTRLKEVSPLHLPDGRWLIGLEDGAVATDLERDIARDGNYPTAFTSYNIEGGGETALGPLTETITLRPDERAMTLTFAALSLSDDATVRYAYRLDEDEEWTPLGTLRTLTFTRLTPGKHRVSVRSTDLTGRWLDNTRTITIDVTPTFWETGWAKTLYALAALSIIGGIIWTVGYMRRIKRKQRETLEAYLSLLEARTAAALPDTDPAMGKDTSDARERTRSVLTALEGTPTEEAEQPAVTVDIPEEDKGMISKVVDYIDANFGDSEITVEDIASAVGVSKSSLTRKMKSLMGVTPADFLRTTRLSKAKVMLKETAAPIKEIAIDCGFSDMNYFGKCFKAAFGVTPSAWRGA